MPKYSDVSLELRNKIRKDMKIHADVYGEFGGIVNFNKNEIHLYQECLKWHEVTMSYFKTSYDCYKMTKIGRYLGVRPVSSIEVVSDSEGNISAGMTFEIDDVEPESWMDWFDIKGEGDGVLQGSMGIIINKRTHPQYYVDGKYIFDKE